MDEVFEESDRNRLKKEAWIDGSISCINGLSSNQVPPGYFPSGGLVVGEEANSTFPEYFSSWEIAVWRRFGFL